MQKTILITGSTDGIGLETAKMLLSQGHRVLLHGRSQKKLEKAKGELSAQTDGGAIESFLADLSRITDVEALADAVGERHEHLDVLINNAGIFHTPEPITQEGLDVRFVVNTLAPYLLTQRLLPKLAPDGRVINLSSAAQSPVDLKALTGELTLSTGEAYAQSKLALTMWSRHLAHALGDEGPAVIAVNPRSFLGSKMVKEAYGVSGTDLRVGADILCRAALSEEFADASGKYFDNDTERFTSPHPDALDEERSAEVVRVIEEMLAL